jgi:hypothetical protein
MAHVNASNNRLLTTCQMVSRTLPPLERKGLPHQSHSVEPFGFFPPHPEQTAISSSGGAFVGGTVGVL